MTTNYRSTLSLFGVLVLTACGGGSNTAPVEQPLSGTKQGFITIEERANKRVFDGWFSQGTVPVQTQHSLWESGNERCVQLLADQPGVASTSIGSRWQDTLYAGNAITVQSRGEEVVRMNAQQYGDATVYATTERWLATPLPDDAMLMINGSDQFPSFESIELAPLTKLVMNAPEGGVMTLYSDPIVWDTSADDSDGIEVLISSSDATVGSAETVKCWLNDDGAFALPAEARALFSPNRQLVVRLSRARYASYESDGATLLITQTSYP
ncbi:MAG: hypothetical protein AB8B84_00155 [Granulosicoccus sp.]